MCRRRGHRVGALVAAAVMLAAGPPVSADQVARNHALVARTLLRALAYDTKLRGRAGEQLVLGVVFRPEHEGSEREAADIKAILQDLVVAVTVQGLPMRVATFSYVDPYELEAEANPKGVDVFYICQGLEDDVGRIIAVARKNSIRTMAARSELAPLGIALTVELAERAVIVVNLKASREEGAAFSSGLLRLAKVIK